MGSGSATFMNTVIKQNRDLLSNPKREKFKTIKGLTVSNKRPEFGFPNSTPQLLRDIKKRMILENECLFYKKIIVFTTILVTLTTLVMLVLS